MRIKTLRSLAIVSVFILLDFSFPELPFIGYDIFPDVIGLVFVLFCSVLLIDKAPSFTRPVVVCIAMLFLEAVRIFGLADDAILVQVLLLAYLFLKALLILFVLEAEAQLCRIREDAETAALADRIGLLYALTFPLRVGELFLPEFQGIFWLLGLSLSVLTLGILFFMFTHVYLPPEDVTAEEPPLPSDDEEEENGEKKEGEEEEKAPAPPAPEEEETP